MKIASRFGTINFNFQPKELAKIVAQFYLPLSIVVAVILLLGYFFDIPLFDLIEDPASVLKTNPFFGVFSNIGILFWSAAAAVSFFTSIVLRNQKVSQKFLQFLFYSGLITSILLVDDLFLLHESLYRYFKIPEGFVFVGYGIMILLYLIKFRRVIINNTKFPFMILAFGLFAISILLDVLIEHSRDFDYFLEDIFKFFAIFTWLIFLAKTSQQAIHSLFDSSSTSRVPSVK